MTKRTDNNGLAIGFMIAAMIGFALADALIKLSSETETGGAGPGQIMIYLGIAGVLVFGGVMAASGERFTRETAHDRMVVLRTAGDLIGVLCFTTALTRMPVGSASAILQIQPLVVMLGAAVFLKEAVTMRRWVAIAIAFCGMIMIIRPGAEAFHPASILVLGAVIGLSIRDLATRALAPTHSTIVVSALISVAIIPMGFAVHFALEIPADFARDTTVLLIASSMCAMAAYYAITKAMRLGEVSAIAPFRYSRLVAAFIVAFILLGERPDAWTLIGSAVIVAAGIWVLMGERRSAV